MWDPSFIQTWVGIRSNKINGKSELITLNLLISLTQSELGLFCQLAISCSLSIDFPEI